MTLNFAFIWSYITCFVLIRNSLHIFLQYNNTFILWGAYLTLRIHQLTIFVFGFAGVRGLRSHSLDRAQLLGLWVSLSQSRGPCWSECWFLDGWGFGWCRLGRWGTLFHCTRWGWACFGTLPVRIKCELCPFVYYNQIKMRGCFQSLKRI